MMRRVGVFDQEESHNNKEKTTELESGSRMIFTGTSCHDLLVREPPCRFPHHDE
jgi:hypothetical protein